MKIQLHTHRLVGGCEEAGERLYATWSVQTAVFSQNYILKGRFFLQGQSFVFRKFLKAWRNEIVILVIRVIFVEVIKTTEQQKERKVEAVYFLLACISLFKLHARTHAPHPPRTSRFPPFAAAHTLKKQEAVGPNSKIQDFNANSSTQPKCTDASK